MDTCIVLRVPVEHFSILPRSDDSLSTACTADPAWQESVLLFFSTLFERVAVMNAILDFMSSWYFIGGMIFLLVLLVAFLVYRLVFAKKEED